MAYRELRKRTGGAGLAAYGCVGAAVVFIFALTFGAFDRAENPRDVAANYATGQPLSTP